MGTDKNIKLHIVTDIKGILFNHIKLTSWHTIIPYFKHDGGKLW